MFKIFSQFKLLSAIFLLSVALLVGGSFWAYFSLKDARQPLILRFNDLAGIVQIGSVRSILGVMLIGLVGVVVNFILAVELEPRSWFLGKFLASATLFLSILIFISVGVIISVN